MGCCGFYFFKMNTGKFEILCELEIDIRTGRQRFSIIKESRLDHTYDYIHKGDRYSTIHMSCILLKVMILQSTVELLRKLKLVMHLTW